jgi:hypothetical protein
LFNPRQRLLAVLSGDDLEALFPEDAGQDPTHIGLIIDDEDLGH